jgi:hypothetical protein
MCETVRLSADVTSNCGVTGGLFSPVAKERAETFPLEVPVVRERFREPLPAHCLHGNAIGEAVALIGTIPVERKTGQK